MVDIYRDAKRRGIYPPLFTDPEGGSFFSIYQIRWIKKRFFNFFFWNFRETTRHFSLRSQNSEYPRLVYTTQVNSAFGAPWLASPEVIIQVLFTSEQPRRNKMVSRFASISEKDILSMNEEAVRKNTKMATKYLMVSYLISPASYYKAKNQNTMPCLRKLSSTKITMKTMKHLTFFSLV